MDKFALTPTQMAAFAELDGEKQAYFLELAKIARGFSFLLWGRPGSGKSYSVGELSKSLAAPVRVIDLDRKGQIPGCITVQPKEAKGALSGAWATQTAASLRKEITRASRAGDCSGIVLDTYTTYSQEIRSAVVDDDPDVTPMKRMRQYASCNNIHAKDATIFFRTVGELARTSEIPGPVVGVVSAHAAAIKKDFVFQSWRIDLSDRCRDAFYRPVAYSLMFDPQGEPGKPCKFRFEWRSNKRDLCKAKAETDREQGIIAECAKTSDLARMVQDLYECRIDMALAQAKAG